MATDFSDCSDVALEYGRELSRKFGATIHVLHVVEDLVVRFVQFPGYVRDLGRLQAETEAAARARLEGLISNDDRRELQATGTVVASASPTDAIIEYAGETQPRIDLIVMGTHGRGALAHAFMGVSPKRSCDRHPVPCSRSAPPNTRLTTNAVDGRGPAPACCVRALDGYANTGWECRMSFRSSAGAPLASSLTTMTLDTPLTPGIWRTARSAAYRCRSLSTVPLSVPTLCHGGSHGTGGRMVIQDRAQATFDYYRAVRSAF